MMSVSKLLTMPCLVLEEIIFLSASFDINTLVTLSSVDEKLKDLIQRRTILAPTKKWGNIISLVALSEMEEEMPSREKIRRYIEMADKSIIGEEVFDALKEKLKIRLGCGRVPDFATCPSDEIKDAIIAAKLMIEEKNFFLDELWLHHVDLSDVMEDDLKQVVSHVTGLVKFNIYFIFLILLNG